MVFEFESALSFISSNRSFSGGLDNDLLLGSANLFTSSMELNFDSSGTSWMDGTAMERKPSGILITPLKPVFDVLLDKLLRVLEPSFLRCSCPTVKPLPKDISYWRVPRELLSSSSVMTSMFSLLLLILSSWAYISILVCCLLLSSLIFCFFYSSLIIKSSSLCSNISFRLFIWI